MRAVSRLLASGREGIGDDTVFEGEQELIRTAWRSEWSEQRRARSFFTLSEILLLPGQAGEVIGQSLYPHGSDEQK